MLELVNSGSDSANEEVQAVVLVQAKQHQLLAEIYHERYLSNGNTADLQHAEKLARSAFNKTTLSAPGDPQNLVSCQLLVLIYQAQRRTSLAEFFQSPHYFKISSLANTSSSITTDRIASAISG